MKNIKRKLMRFIGNQLCSKENIVALSSVSTFGDSSSIDF